MLVLEGLSKHFGGVRAVDDVDLTIERGQIVGLIGPNGSGKSTIVNLICGLFPVTSGRVLFESHDITTMPTHRRLTGGIARTFQNIRLFENLTVGQNLWVAQNGAEDIKRGFFRRWLSGARQGREEVEELLEFSRLNDKRDVLARNLAFGEQRRLEMARALAAKPSLLLLDEPAAGMSAEEVSQLAERILALHNMGKTIVLVEHVMELVMGITERIAVLNFGRKIAEGTPQEIQDNQLVRDAYLGGSAEPREQARA